MTVDCSCCKPGGCCGEPVGSDGGDTSTTQKKICCGCCCKNCLPYNDPCMLTAQILSIVAFLVSWIWYVTFILGVAALTLLQVIWCCRVGRAGLISTVVIAGLTSLACFSAGILMVLTWKDDQMCHVFTMEDDTVDSWYNDQYSYDYCNEVAWALVAFATGILWGATAICVLVFLVSGRHARSVEAQSQNHAPATEEQETNIELGSIPSAIPYIPTGEAVQDDALKGSMDVVVPAAFVLTNASSEFTEKV